MPRLTRILVIVAAFLASLIVALTVTLFIVAKNEAGSSVSVLPTIGGPFRLVDQNGQVRTEADLKGHPTLLFFGFTNCPDICPTTLFEVSELLRQLGAAAAGARAIFVTVD